MMTCPPCFSGFDISILEIFCIHFYISNQCPLRKIPADDHGNRRDLRLSSRSFKWDEKEVGGGTGGWLDVKAMFVLLSAI
jgi:hypothetical protein